MSNKLLHIFFDVDMRCSHEGLGVLVKKKKIKINEGDFVCFLNRTRNIVKMFCGSQDALLHYKKDGRVIDPQVIKYLPKYAGGSEIDMDAAIKEHISKVLNK